MNNSLLSLERYFALAMLRGVFCLLRPSCRLAVCVEKADGMSGEDDVRLRA
jgi:hypothetical protein